MGGFNIPVPNINVSGSHFPQNFMGPPDMGTPSGTGTNSVLPPVFPGPGPTGPPTQQGPATGGAGNFNFGNMSPNPAPANPMTGFTGAPTGGDAAGPGGSSNSNPTNTPPPPSATPPPSPGTIGAPGTSMNPGGGNSSNPFMLDPRQTGRSLAEFQKYYGEGMGAMLFNYLQSGGGFNSALTQQAVDAQIAAMQQQITRGLGNLDTQMGESGISPNSSAWALETGDYESQAVAQENAITAQEYFNMWDSSQNRLAGLLGHTSDVHATGTANEGGFMSFLNGILGAGSSAVGLAGG